MSQFPPNRILGASFSPEPDGVRLQVLGPLRVWRDGVEVIAGPHQQAMLLAHLVVRAGRPVGIAEILAAIWGDSPPESAVNIIRKYVGALRRLFEPGLGPRRDGRYLLSRGDGYMTTLREEELDLLDFRRCVARADALSGQDDERLELYVKALDMWVGPTAHNFDGLGGLSAEFASVNEELYSVVLKASELATSLGRLVRIVPSLKLAASIAPLNEPLHEQLIHALSTTGQRAEALGVFHSLRTRLADELGIDPSEGVVASYRRVLHESNPMRRVVKTPDDRPLLSVPDAQHATTTVGRAVEIAELRHVCDAAIEGRPSAAIVEGQAGAGKSHLLDVVDAWSSHCGAVTLRARCLAGRGSPSMWPWMEVVRSLLDHTSPLARNTWSDGPLGVLAGGRTKALDEPMALLTARPADVVEQLVELVAEVARDRALVIILDDLQWADSSTLRVVAGLARRLPARTALIVALRDRFRHTTGLTEALVALGRVRENRSLAIGPLDANHVRELASLVAGQDVDDLTATRIHRRSGGNAFFVRELARSWVAAGASSEDLGVPATVQEAIRDRMNRLRPPVISTLEAAALIGAEVDLDVLSMVCGLSLDDCFARLEPAVETGLILPNPDNPFAYQFSHDLVREAVSESTSQRRAHALHVEIAATLERVRPGFRAVEELAHHLWAAGPLVEPARAARALLAAARAAAAKSALDVAERHLVSALALSGRTDDAELELTVLSEAIALSGMRSLQGEPSKDLLESTARLANAVDGDVPSTFASYSDWVMRPQRASRTEDPLVPAELERAAESEQLLVRALGLQALGLACLNSGEVSDGKTYLLEAAMTLDRLGNLHAYFRGAELTGVVRDIITRVARESEPMSIATFGDEHSGPVTAEGSLLRPVG